MSLWTTLPSIISGHSTLEGHGQGVALEGHGQGVDLEGHGQGVALEGHGQGVTLDLGTLFLQYQHQQ